VAAKEGLLPGVGEHDVGWEREGGV
jgi:hypothetical protein